MEMPGPGMRLGYSNAIESPDRVVEPSQQCELLLRIRHASLGRGALYAVGALYTCCPKTGGGLDEEGWELGATMG